MELVDTFGRTHRDLRISLTDRCNYRCTYCMPEGGLDWTPAKDVLTAAEVLRVAKLLVTSSGIDSIRLTGGEPTMRHDLVDIISTLSGLGVDLALTTNGSTLAKKAKLYREAGLRRINISLDSLDRNVVEKLTKRDGLAKVLSGIDAAVDADFSSVKINTVLIRGVNDSEIIDFLNFGRNMGVNVRFIEFMPLDAHGDWTQDQVVSKAEILDAASAAFEFAPVEHGSAPAQRFAYSDGQGEFGIIPSVTDQFCSTCDRVRLTADGQLRNCLFTSGHLDLRALLRSGATDAELLEAIAGEISKKAQAHGIGEVYFVRPSKSMSQIGG